jgi:hypothetical protein
MPHQQVEARFGGFPFVAPLVHCMTDQLSEPSSDSEVPVVLYRARWMMLLLFSLLTLSNAMLWITYAPIASVAQQWFEVRSIDACHYHSSIPCN